jgi:UPF0755 protein
MSSTLTPRRRTTRYAAWLITLLLVAVAVAAAMGILLNVLSPVTTDKTAPLVLVAIPSGANAKSIGTLLARRHLVRRAFGFVFAARLEGVADKMQAGRYEISPAMPPRQIAALIALGKTASDVVTIPEGYTIVQIARRLGQQHMADPQAFLTLAQTQGMTFHAGTFQPPDNDLEGYLYPDTYRIPKGTSERDIITIMLLGFDKRVVEPNAAAFTRYPGGLAAAVNLASLVEREAEVPRDRPLIAAALTNRLKKGMRLECDATVQYALPQHKARLFYADLRVNSPYNTYTHGGLPPTPICNPGLPCIEAALHPARVDYLFYVARPDGSHIFSRTLAEHDQAIAQLRALRKGT